MQDEKILSASTMVIFVIMNFVITMNNFMFTAILDQLAVELNVSVAQSGSFSAYYEYGAGIGVPVFLILFQRFNRTTLLKWMLALHMVTTLLLVIVKDFSAMLIVRFMMGLSGNCYGVMASATIAALSSREKVGRNVAVLICGSAIAMALGVPMTRVLAEALSWRGILVILAGIMAVSLVYFLVKLPATESEQKKLNLLGELALLKEKPVYALLITCALTFIGYGAFYTYMTPYFLELFPESESLMSLILVLVGAACFLGNMFGGQVCDRIGFKRAYFIGAIVQLITIVLMVLCRQWMVPEIIVVLLWMANSWFIGLQVNTGINIVSHNQSKLMVALNSTGLQLGQAIGASIASSVIVSFGMRWITLVDVVLAAVVVVLFLLFKENR